MLTLQIFEPSLCCASGVCGPEPEKELIELQNLIQSLNKAGVKVERFAINKSPMEFVNNSVVKEFMKQNGAGHLPLTLWDNQIIKQESYPTRDELMEYIPALKDIKPDNKILGIFS